jgi:dihydrofolate reductase
MISMICAVGKNREIGYKNKLLWNLPGDMNYFREKTKGKTVIMGDKTFESIGHALPGRKNIVVSLISGYKAEGCEVSNDLNSVLEKYKNEKGEVFVIGGATIYRLSLPYADKLYLTLVEDAPQADAFFPDYSEFKNIIWQSEYQEENGIKYKFVKLTK